MFSSFFRYFRVDFNSPCPFWEEEGTCSNEGCQICACEPNEIPKTWLGNRSSDEDYGWISNHKSSDINDQILQQEQLHILNVEDIHWVDKKSIKGD